MRATFANSSKGLVHSADLRGIEPEASALFWWALSWKTIIQDPIVRNDRAAGEADHDRFHTYLNWLSAVRLAYPNSQILDSHKFQKTWKRVLLAMWQAKGT